MGTSVRKDVLELLEKRVRSRFSHQQLAVLEPCALDPTTAAEQSPGGVDAGAGRGRRRGGRRVPAAGDAPLAVLAAMLRLPARPGSAATAAHADFALRFNAAADAAVADPRVARAFAARHCWPAGTTAGACGRTLRGPVCCNIRIRTAHQSPCCEMLARVLCPSHDARAHGTAGLTALCNGSIRHCIA